VSSLEAEHAVDTLASDTTASGVRTWEIRGFLRQLLRYGLVSGLALGVDFSLLIFLREVCGFHVLAANSLSFSAGLLVTFFFSRLWVFDKRTLKSGFAEFGAFALIGVTGLGVNNLILWAGMELGADYRLAKIAAASVTFFWNFLLRKYFLYR